MQSFIDRIKEINPQVNCVVDDRFHDALIEAAEADSLIASKKYSNEQLEREKPFLGVPMTTKDCIMVKDLLNTAGIYSRRNIRGKEDSVAVGLMRKSGAIPFALTNVPECCIWWETYNKINGRTKNPYDTNRIVGGSSGGEGCVQAAGGSPFGLGSDLGGSVRMPAFFNGIFGHKPSKNIVSTIGHNPSPVSAEQISYFSIGPMTRFATDLKPMMKVLSGENVDLLNLDEEIDLKKINVFYQHNDSGGVMVSPVDSDIEAAIIRVVDHFKNEIKSEVKQVQIELFKYSTPIWGACMKNVNEPGLDEHLANLQGRINPRNELIKRIFGKSNHTLIAILSAMMAKKGDKFGSVRNTYLRQYRDELLKEVETMLGTNGILIYPTHPTPAPYHNEPITKAMNFSYAGIFNVLGLPATAIPMGLGREGLPIGIQVIAGLNQDRLCLAVACELEKVFGGWVSTRIV